MTPSSVGILRVGLAGLGHVGGELARRLAGPGPRPAGASRSLRLVRVCDRRAQAEARRAGLPSSVKRSARPEDLLRDPAVDVVVELLGGLEDSRRLVLAALRSGRDVVTANKLLLSRRWEEVLGAARRSGRSLRFEAAVAGSVPVVEALRAGLAADRVRELYGILNGTTNYILTRMAHDGWDAERSLREARRLGMAERNASQDLSGADTAHKLSVLASLAAGAWLPPERIPRRGIEGLEPEDVRFAAEKLGRTIRLLGGARFAGGGKVRAAVRPVLLPLDHPLAAVHDGGNAVLVRAEAAGDLAFLGPGAGPAPAASAVLADLAALARGDVLASPPPAARLKPAPEPAAPWLLRLRVRDVPGALGRLADLLGRERVSIAQIHQSPPRLSRAVVRIVTHAADPGRLSRVEAALARRRGLFQDVVRLPLWP